MTHKERFHATIERREVDRPAAWLGMPVPQACDGLFKHFKTSSIDELKTIIDDDIYPIDVPYHHPPANHIACAFDFAQDQTGTYKERTLTTPGFFENSTDPADVERFPWPNPAEHMTATECSKAFDTVPPDRASMGMMWSAHFQDACAAFGMEAAMMKIVTHGDVFRAVIDRITEFYLEANQIFYEASDGKLDAVLIGNDMGCQTGLMLSPALIRQFVLPGTRKLITQAKGFGVKVIYHSCGSIFDIIGDLIDIGVDAIHPIQALAKDMNPRKLKDAFGDRVSFCGGVDVQDLLVHGTPDDVRKNVHELKTLFPTGLIISPSHEAVLQDVDPTNLQALFDAVRE